MCWICLSQLLLISIMTYSITQARFSGSMKRPRRDVLNNNNRIINRERNKLLSVHRNSDSQVNYFVLRDKEICNTIC